MSATRRSASSSTWASVARRPATSFCGLPALILHLAAVEAHIPDHGRTGLLVNGADDGQNQSVEGVPAAFPVRKLQIRLREGSNALQPKPKQRVG
jgi:hypothetical protein